MRKYLLRYFIFWLPAFAVAVLYANATPLSHILQWFFGFFMLFGWSVNTGMAAYHQPRAALSALLAYMGVVTMITVVLYTTSFRDTLHIVARLFGGVALYWPMGIILKSIQLLGNKPWELVLLLVLGSCCLIGYLVGLLQRRSNPNPYRPRINRIP